MSNEYRIEKTQWVKFKSPQIVMSTIHTFTTKFQHWMGVFSKGTY